MRKARAVCDSSVLIAFAKIRRLDLLLDAFESPLLIPYPVYAEAVDAGVAKREPDAFLIRKKFNDGSIAAKKPKKHVDWPFLGVGESAVISLALQNKIACVCLDEAPARNAAKRVGLKPVGTLGILYSAYQNGSLSRHQTLDLLGQLIRLDFRISPKILEQFKKSVS